MKQTIVFLAFILSVSFSFFVQVSPAHAQLSPSIPGSSDTSSAYASMWFELSPQNPGPNEPVTVRFITYAGELSTAEIGWFINGQPFDAGIGRSTITIRTSALGEPTEVMVVVKFVDGKLLTHSLSIVPARVALLWEADSYVPPFYKGKALHTFGQDAILVAMPNFVVNGETVPASSLLYEWYVGPTKLPESGVGKQRIVISGDALRLYRNARVVVSTLDKTSSSEASLEVPSTFPKLHLYEINPLYGRIYEKSLSGKLYSGTGEFSIIATPYYFNKSSVEKGLLSVGWSLLKATSTSYGLIQTFSPIAGAAGTSILSVSASDPSNIFMQSNTTIEIRYGNAQRSFF